jgi:hypothetical protein
MSRYRGWFGEHAKRYCPHSMIEDVSEKDIQFISGFELKCLDCGHYLDGPKELAKIRNEHERDIKWT